MPCHAMSVAFGVTYVPIKHHFELSFESDQSVGPGRS
jgi:hypothetical protein